MRIDDNKNDLDLFSAHPVKFEPVLKLFHF